MDALLVLTNIAVLLLLGSLCSLLAKKLGISDVLVLLLLGVVVGRISYNNQSLFVFDNSLLVAIGVLALIMVVFDTASRFRIKEHSAFAPKAFGIIALFVFLNILLVPLFFSLVFSQDMSLTSLLVSLVLALVVIATDMDAVMVMLKDYVGLRAKNILSLLQVEAIISTGLVVVIPFIIIDIIRDVWLLQTGASSSAWNLITLLGFQLIVGVGSGVVVGLIVLRTLQKLYSHHFSSISLLAGVLIAYLLAENLGGNGALAAASLGFLFGKFYVRDKPKLQEFSCMLSNAVEILVFIILGLIIRIPFTFEFILGSLLIFLIILLTRMGAIFTVLRKDYSLREKLFMGMNMPKGIATAVILLSLALYGYTPFELLLQVMLAFMIYSLILSTIVDKLSLKLVKDEKIPVRRIRSADMISLDKTSPAKSKASKAKKKSKKRNSDKKK